MNTFLVAILKALKKGEMPAAVYAGAVNPPFTDTEKIIGMVGTTFDNTPVNIHQVLRRIHSSSPFCIIFDHAFLSFLTLKAVFNYSF